MKTVKLCALKIRHYMVATGNNHMIKFIQSSLEACQSVVVAKLLDVTLYSSLFQLLKKCWPRSAKAFFS